MKLMEARQGSEPGKRVRDFCGVYLPGAPDAMDKHTILNDSHRALGARMVSFGGWNMPVHYGSQIEEHHAVRQDAGMFDVSHMTAVDLNGAGTRDFLRYLLANDLARLPTTGKAMYSCMLDHDGGVIDDLIVYYLADDHCRLVVNAGTTEKDLAWMRRQSRDYAVSIRPRRDLAIIAIQGPRAREKTLPLLPDFLAVAAEALSPFSAIQLRGWFVGRTGYTGEDGFEVILPETKAVAFWQQLRDAGVRPCGLGARDTLRLEAGMNLYGADMDETVTPLESGLAWTLRLDERPFIGRDALLRQQHRPHARLTGLLLQGRGVLRRHQKLYAADQEVGEVTSGGFSPTLQRSIALARIQGEECQDLTVEIRGKRMPVQVVQPPFVRKGKPCIAV